jgi:hypothetical protein
VGSTTSRTVWGDAVTSQTGDIEAYRCDDGTVRLVVTPGPIRITKAALDQAAPEWLTRAENILIFCSREADGLRRSYRYRITGEEPSGFEGGFVSAEPVDEVTQ